jgi:hypothetical protein
MLNTTSKIPPRIATNIPQNPYLSKFVVVVFTDKRRGKVVYFFVNLALFNDG